MKTLSNREFKKLISKATCDTGADLETVGLTAEYGKMHINFYAEAESDHNLSVECYGKLKNNGSWGEDYKLTQEQEAQLQNLISKQVAQITQEQEAEAYEDMQPELPRGLAHSIFSDLNTQFSL
tara:strand:- start:181 stop:552 length:372 start_codon:yes stop_codon:yes gene_type:complete